MSPASPASGRHELRRFLIALAAFWLVVAGIYVVLRHRAPFNPPPSAEVMSHRPSEGDTLPVLWSAPEFRFPDQDEATVSNASLAGHVWIADFFYSQCTTVCPLLTAQFIQLQRAIASPDLRFVSFSVDPAHDTPAVLHDYAALWGADPRWRLLSTTDETLTALAKGMRVTVAAGIDSANAIIHSSVFLLVDGQGQVRGAYESGSAEALARLVKDAEGLAASAAAPPAPAATPAATAAARGEALYQALGCAGCHMRPSVAPPLNDLIGATIVTTGGDSVAVDDAYLRESILQPAKTVVAGYLSLMPSYAGSLDAGQLDDLIAYLESRHAMPGMEAATAGTAELVTDPVCHMQVRAVPETLHADHDGKTYYFCSEYCRDSFVADPARYLAAAADKH